MIIYSHGLGGERTEATALVEDLASHGYVVVTIDHIHDATVVELPNGHVETTALPQLTKDNELQVTTKAIEARVADTRFVLDRLAAIDRGANPDIEHRPLPRGLLGALDLTRIGMLGHSDGGATTGAVMHVDPRVSAGVNLDGTFWTPDAAAGSDRPMLLFGSEVHRRDDDPTWATFWTSQRGPKLQLNLIGSAHETFHDLALMLPKAAPTLGIPPDTVTRVVGTINGERATAIVRAYVNAYFDRYLRHHRSRLLNGPSARYPEIHFTP
jgi:predicted dienelactone hydrolase